MNSSRFKSAACMGLALAALFPAELPSQERSLRSRPRSVKPAATVLHAGLDGMRIVLKLQDDLAVRAMNGRLVPQPGAPDLSVVLAAIDAVPGVVARRLLQLSEATLQQMRAQGEWKSGERLADLRTLFLLDLPAGANAAVVCDLLNALPEVEIAYPAPLPVEPPGDIVPPPTPNFAGFQGYRGPAPGGIGAASVITQQGGTAAGVTIADIEYAWEGTPPTSSIPHEDMSAKGPNALLGPMPVSPYGPDHGTAVVGMLFADNDSAGITGLCPGGNLRVVAAYTSAGYSVANAIVLATNALMPGDVILVEQQTAGPNFPGGGTQTGLVAVEYHDAEFYAIRQATALGIHVVEAAGNGGQDWDSATPPIGHPSYLQKFDVAARDSGAVIVAAATSTVPHAPMWFTNYGTRIDAHAWGQNVFTLGYGPNSPSIGCPNPFTAAGGDSRQWYTGCFGGTSSASPMVAAALAIHESRHVNSHGQPYKPWAARALLRTLGTAPASGSSPIGLMPDLAQSLSVVSQGDHVAYRWEEGCVAAVAGPGDLNGDGYPDLVVGTPPTVRVYSGATGGELYLVTGPSSFGQTLAAAGDVDGDGRPEFLVGAPYSVSAYLYSGATGVLIHSWTGPTGSSFGSSLSGAGDIDGDGITDVVVGAPYNSSQPGRAYVYSGGSGQPVFPSSLQFQGLGAGDEFGRAVAVIGDTNGDARSEFAVGAPYDDTAGPNAGAVFFYDGATGSLLFPLAGPPGSFLFGRALCELGDVNGNVAPDCGIADYYDLASYDGASYLASWIVPASVSQIARAGDLNGDGISDVIGGTGSNAKTYSGASGALLNTYNGCGSAVASAGDVDLDGSSDVICGSCSFSSIAALVFLSEGQAPAPPAPTLTASSPTLFASLGGQIDLTFQPAAPPAGALYLILASASGFNPGLTMPGGIGIPLNIDGFTFLGLTVTPLPPFGAFFGLLPSAGSATATFGPFPPVFLSPFVGTELTFVALALAPPLGSIDSASNPVTVTILPQP